VTLKRRSGQFYGRIARTRRASGVSLTEAEYPPGFRTPRHVHDQAYFCVILEGVGRQTYGTRTRSLRPLTSYFCPAGEAHSETLDAGRGREFIIGFTPEWLDRLRGHAAVGTVSVDFQGGAPAWLGMRAYDELLHPDAASPLAIEGIALELLAAISRQYRGVSGRRPPRWLAAARDMLHEHLAQPLSLGDVAGAVGVHPVHLAREFRRWYRCSVGDYARRVRVDLARDAILTTDAPLGEIAYRAGFSDHSHFTRTFKRLTGMTPRECRATKNSR
jgi:AraC family transcriptional regulator